MEVVQGKSRSKKIVIAQEIAFAKVLAGNNKTLRDRAVKKLKKWLTVRGNGKWAFTEEEFLRIWTGLFYCMWMSDKFLVQEELAENISHLVHCFKKNITNALLFITSFHKKLIMEWDGLDQYRIDKFNMLMRRFLRQTFEYCKEKDWEEVMLRKLLNLFYHVVLHRDNALGFVLHFISIYNEELAKVSKGHLQNNTVLILVEPFVKLLAKTKDDRIRVECEDFFHYLMRQTDIGIEFEEQFNAWKQRGFPGTGPDCLEKIQIQNNDSIVDSDEEDSVDENNEPLDPRAGSVHVFLPQIPIVPESMINLFHKYKNSSNSTPKGRKALKRLLDKFLVLKKGKFPEKIEKDPILDENMKKRKQTEKNAKCLLEYTKNLDKDPIKTKEFLDLCKELNEQSEDEESEDLEKDVKVSKKKKTSVLNENYGNDGEVKLAKKSEKIKIQKLDSESENFETSVQSKKAKSTAKNLKSCDGANLCKGEEVAPRTKKKNKKIKNGTNGYVKNETNKRESEKKILKTNSITKEENLSEIYQINSGVLDAKKKLTPVKKRGILSNWQVQELDTNSPEYYNIQTQKIIRIERKLDDSLNLEENREPGEKKKKRDEWQSEEKEEIFPVFWNKALAKVNKKKSNNGNTFKNPFAELSEEMKSPGLKRISFALDRNMAQENEEYLNEVKNSPRVPFDGTKKPIQSALKSGLSPSPVNPFYRYKKIKF